MKRLSEPDRVHFDVADCTRFSRILGLCVRDRIQIDRSDRELWCKIRQGKEPVCADLSVYEARVLFDLSAAVNRGRRGLSDEDRAATLELGQIIGAAADELQAVRECRPSDRYKRGPRKQSAPKLASAYAPTDRPAEE